MRAHAPTSVLSRFPSSRSGSIFFLAALLLAVSFRHFVLDAEDPNRCTALVTKGQWYQDHTWLTPGCVSEHYGWHEINDCVDKRKLVFAGDATIQMLYWEMARRLDGNVNPELGESHLRYSNDKVTLEYLWDPFMNGTALYDALARQRARRNDAPMMLIVGGGQWHAQNHATELFASSVDNIISAAQLPGPQPNIGSRTFSKQDGPGDLLLFHPVQAPYSDSPEVAPELAAYRDLNSHLHKRADEKVINVLWSFDSMTSARKDQYIDNSVQEEVLRQRIDVLLNLRCNAKAASHRSFPNTRTCCGAWAGPNWIQTCFLLLGLLILPTLVLIDGKLAVLRPDDRPIVRALCAFTSTVSLIYITDRTHIFEQVQRLPLVTSNLRNMVLFIILLGAFTIQRSKPPRSMKPGEKQPDHPFLPRDQTEEWKGWMQALIIVYHYNMAWSADWFWQIIRLAVASYLFLTGFGHTVYFLQKKDYSLKRVMAVLIRTNLLPCALAYVMRTRWLLYYYMPLSTFWFLVVYATLAVGSRYNDYTLFLISKILASAALIRAFLNTPDLPETVVRLFALTCNISFDARAFFDLRVRSDEYIVYIGMLMAILYLWAKDVLSSDRRQDGLSSHFRRHFPLLKHTTTAVSLIAFLGFWYWIHNHIHTQSDFVGWQPYITFIPILSFTLLRNAHPTLRNFHSVAFAWLGRYSGEMYVMQDHTWLAGDQEAVLRTGLFHGDETVSRDRWRDMLVVTPLYLIACSVVGDATVVIANAFVAEPATEAKSQLLPGGGVRDEVEMGLLAGSGDGELEQDLDEKVLPRKSVWGRLRNALWPNKIRDRAILVLLFMWFLNMTYT